MIDLKTALQSRFPHLPTRAGFYAVGGAVRDFLLRRDAVDVDLTGDNAYDAARELATATGGTLVELGRDPISTWRVIIAGLMYDFTELTGGSVENDLARRDFTINAMAVDLSNGELFDPFGGRRDLEQGIVRMVREENFVDDPLRVLRGIRMAATNQFTIHPGTMEAIARHAPAIKRVTAERVRQELDILLSHPARARSIPLLREAALDRPLFDVGLPSIREQELDAAQGADRIVAYALLLRDHPESFLVDFARRWRWSEVDKRALLQLFRFVASAREVGALELLLHEAGRETADRAIVFLRASGEEALSKKILETLNQDRELLFESDSLLTGDEIAAVTGLKPGPSIGAAKRALREAQLQKRVTSPQEAERFVREWAAGLTRNT